MRYRDTPPDRTRRQGGFTLPELLLALLILSIATNELVKIQRASTEQKEFSALGNMLAKHQEAVAAWIIDQGGTAANSTQVGVNWLKDKVACSLSAGGSKQYLPCDFDFTTNRWGASPTSVITNTGGITVITTTWPAIMKTATVAMSVGAGQAVTQAEAASVSDLSSFISYTDDNNGVITATVNVNNGTGIYVKRSGDTMTGDLDMGTHNISGIGVLSATSANITGNTQVGGTLTANQLTSATSVNAANANFTGNTTIGGSATVSGALSASTVVATGSMSAGSVVLNDNYTVGSACTSKTVGTTSTGQLLACVNGVWKDAQSASGGSGLSGVFAPHAGYTISCGSASVLSCSWCTTTTYYARVNGTTKVPEYRVVTRKSASGQIQNDTGWVVGTYKKWQVDTYTTKILSITTDRLEVVQTGEVTSDGNGAGSWSCTAQWPIN